MYPYFNLPRPLPPAEFYILLALSSEPSYGYALRAQIRNASLGSVTIRDDKIYTILIKLESEAFIDQIGKRSTHKRGEPRMHYEISEHGLLRLKEELLRQNHAIKIAEAKGLMENETPIEIQRMLLDVQTSSNAEA
jgi:DNA-binding PadR family transcriptional regulator